MISLKELKKLAVESGLLCHDKSTDKMGLPGLSMLT